MKGLAVILTIWIAVAVSQVVHASGDVVGFLQAHCEETGVIERCAEQHGNGYTMQDIFSKMSSNLTELRDYCDNSGLLQCISGCMRSFQLSKHGYLLNICSNIRVFEWEDHCWDSSFPEEARLCYRWVYPSYRIVRLYPIPIRVYDRHTIARDCFPNEAPSCRYFKSDALRRLMPHFYIVHGYPERFNHISDYIGFPGYSYDD